MTAIVHQPTSAIQNIAAPSAETLQQILVDGDLEKLNPEQRLQFYRMRCDAAGLDPRSQPFQFVKLNNKLVLYATKSATQQLTAKNKISHAITGAEESGGLIEYRIRATRPDGHFQDDIGVVAFSGVKGSEAHANARLKAVTKGKRRATLAICGLEVMDESEIPEGATPVSLDLASPAATAVPPFMTADLSSRLRAIVTVNKIPTPEVARVVTEATGGRKIDRSATGGYPLYSEAEYSAIVAGLKGYKAPAPAPAAAPENPDAEAPAGAQEAGGG